MFFLGHGVEGYNSVVDVMGLSSFV